MKEQEMCTVGSQPNISFSSFWKELRAKRGILTCVSDENEWFLQGILVDSCTFGVKRYFSIFMNCTYVRVQQQ